MSATSAAARRPAVVTPDTVARIVRGPSEGWFALALVIFMALIVGWSIDDPGWVGNRSKTDFLAMMGVFGALTGFAVAKLDLPRWRGHLVGAIVAALVIPTIVGASLLTAGAPIGELFHATAESTVQAWVDLAIRGRQFTSEIGHFLLVLGILVWGTAQFAAYAVFGHRRPIDAVIVVGIVLLGSMASTGIDQYWYLVLFSVAALLLLTRLHAIEEGATWQRRRIGDPAAVRSLYQTGGSIFVAVAIVLALVLTATASSAPLAGLVTGMERRLIELSLEIQRVLPAAGDARSLGVSFGPTAAITGSWTPSNTRALVVKVEPGDLQRHYWRTVVHDFFTGEGWRFSETLSEARPAGVPILAGSAGDLPLLSAADDPMQFEGRRTIEFSVTPDQYVSTYGVSPEGVVSTSRESTLFALNTEGRFQAFDLGDSKAAYTVTARVPILDEDDEDAITQAKLQQAGTDYPEDILEVYLQVPKGVIGPEAEKLRNRVVDLARSDRPYDIAQAMETYLRSGAFQYENNVRYTNCGLGTVECFATFKVGYCMYYASTMAILLRDLGIPARLAQGYLPSPRDPETGIESVNNSGAHAWVEVYFPGYGWIDFDPTGGGLTDEANPPPGEGLETPRPSGSAPRVTPKIEGTEPPEFNPNRGGIDSPGGGGGPGSTAGLIAIGGLLALTVAGLAFIAWQRGPRGPVTPETAWLSLAGLARRLGFGPRPTETVYEYAGALGDVVPEARVELDTVARAKVEVAYGRRELGDERLRGLRDATRRLRVSLLRLAVRRRGRRR